MGEQQLSSDTTVESLPDQALLYIFTCINPYRDLDSVRMVCRRWHFLATKAIGIMERAFLRCDQFRWKLCPQSCSVTHRFSHSTCYHRCSKSMYVFGGCTASYTVFNDLWQMDLGCRKWNRVLIRSSPFPSPKALATLVPYGDNLLLYGGFSRSSPNPLRRISKFFDEVHLFSFAEQRWIELIAENEGPKLAGHSATIVDDSMIVFGGLLGESSSNAIFVFDIKKCRWWSPQISSKCLPPSRYGHSQALIDHNHLLIVGGCIGLNSVLNDAWLLTFDLNGSIQWEWNSIKIVDQEVSAYQLWCHTACNVGTNIVALGSQNSATSNLRKVKVASALTPLTLRGAHSAEGDAMARELLLRNPRRNECPASGHKSTRYSNTSAHSDERIRQSKVQKPLMDNENASISSEGMDISPLMSKAASNVVEGATCSRFLGQSCFAQSNGQPRGDRACGSAVADFPTVSDFRNGSHLSSTDCRVNKSAERRAWNGDAEKPSSSRCSVNPTDKQSLQSRHSLSLKDGKFHGHTRGFMQRRLCVYVLDISKVISQGVARWRQQRLEWNAPYDLLYYSICAGRGELIIFGGLYADYTDGDFYFDKYSTSNDTYVLQPRYSI